MEDGGLEGGLEGLSGHILLDSLFRPMKKHDSLAEIFTSDVATQYLAYNLWNSSPQATYG